MRRVILAMLLSVWIQGALWGQSVRVGTSDQIPAESPVNLYLCPPCVSWDSRTAAHLIRRAGFSAPPEELDRLVEIGFEATLNELLNYEGVDDSEMEKGLAEKNYPLTKVNQNNGKILPNTGQMQRWWLFRMVNSKRQLLEKMTYFWHDHFATSVKTVKQVAPDGHSYMMAQNDLLRKYALGNFKEMVEAVTVDPAMLVWLDNRSNVKKRPNENWARELVELFTMGVGNYTDEDVMEAARAFSGWGLNNKTGKSTFYRNKHDLGMKIFLDVTGPLDGGDVIDIIFEQDVTAEFIARKLFKFFVYTEPSREVIVELADVFRKSGYEMRPLMRAIFEHPEFYSDRAYRSLIKSPTELLVGMLRELGMSDPQFLPRYMIDTGQELFAPPDVSGWTSGVGWVNTATVLARYNFFNYLTSLRGEYSLDFVEWLDNRTPKYFPGYQLSFFDIVALFLDAIVKGDVSVDTRYELEQYMTTADDGKTVAWDIADKVMFDKKTRGVLYLISILPAYQLN